MRGVMPTETEDAMTDQVTERLVPPEDLAELLSVSTGQLAQMRYLGTGPQYVKVGTRVRYALSDVRAWLDDQRRSRT
jgi:predicted DNA-binding transcriptional regulator AlpA